VELDVRRTFTSVHLRIILVENHHPFLIVERNPLLCEGARDMAGRVAQAMKQASRGASSCTPRYWTGTWKPRQSSPYPGLLLLRYAGSWTEQEEKHLGGAGKPDHPGSHEMAHSAGGTGHKGPP